MGIGVLPRTLVAFLLLSPTFLAFAAPPTSRNDLFRAITIRITPKAEPPICCLIPLPPVDPVEPDILLSFEEWKEKQSASKGKEKDSAKKASPPPASGTDLTNSAPALVEEPVVSNGSTQELAESPQSPHTLIPLTDRFNYASLDCSARVHLAHRSAKSPASILSSKRDRYMLSPCNSPKEKQFVVVELCDDIRIDTVQMANFEFFSGVFKEFSVRVAKTYTTNDDGWTDAGTYTAKNVRGVQSFHPPRSLRDFYRFIRIDFHSHYSNEYYCPVSLLRVYGLTHLEEWKWEIWEEESKAKKDGAEAVVEQSSLESIEVVPTSSSSVVAPSSVTAQVATGDTFNTVVIPHEPVEPFPTETVLATLNDIPPAIPEPVVTPNVPAISETADRGSTEEAAAIVSETSKTTSKTEAEIKNTGEAVQSPSIEVPPSDTSASAASSTVTLTSTVNVPPVATSTGGESIYRTIMNRLTALEGNHTLYARYVEEQTSGVREMLRRLGEDVGRLDGITKARSQTYQRRVTEWEQQRLRLESEYRELMSKVDYLSEEIVLEKRLGIAQLCLLMAVLVFMGLTRGSRGEPLMEHGPVMFNKSMKDWSRRHLNFSGNWVRRFTSQSRSRSPVNRHPEDEKEEASDSELKYGFPSSKPLKSAIKSGHIASARPKSSTIKTRSRTPSLRTPTARQFHIRVPVTPATALLSAAPNGIRKRANSQDSDIVGPVPKSARRLARTAHLHEVKGGMNSARSPRVKAEDSDLGSRSPDHHHALSLPEAIGEVFSTGNGRRKGGLLSHSAISSEETLHVVKALDDKENSPWPLFFDSPRNLGSPSKSFNSDGESIWEDTDDGERSGSESDTERRG
ncbi:UNC-like C-terminal-domain-containing protein [Mycena floridula]|nr:UNC-like C-terminal-domain-containing protein [Mycena floridula]